MLARILHGAAQRFGDRPAIVRPDGAPCGFAELEERVEARANALASVDVVEGSRVALAIASNIDYVVTYLAAARLGATTAGINPSLAVPEQERLVAHLAPTLLVADHPIDAAGCGRTTPENLARLDDHSTPPRELDEDPERAVAIVYTSGTTGTPKGAVFRNRQFRAICDIDLGEGWESNPPIGGPLVASTQLAHVGMMTKLAWYLHTGCTLHLISRWRADDVLRLVAAERISTLGVIAPQLALMLRSALMDELDLRCVERIIAGGAASPPALVREARERFGARYSIRYSSTESGGVGLATSWDAPDDEALWTIGRPRPGVEARIVDSDGADVAPGRAGELVLRSAATCDGYWNDPTATDEVLRDGWLHTADLARFDAAGCVRLAGRRREMYIRGGYNVAPADVEAVLGDHPAVASIAIAPRPDPVMGEIGVAVVVAQSDERPTLASLRAFGAERLARWKLPEDLVVVDELPLTPMHKPDRRRLAELATANANANANGDDVGRADSA